MAIYGDDKHLDGVEYLSRVEELTREEQEVENALKWFEENNIKAYKDGGNVFVEMDNERETHIMISSSEVSYRSDLYLEGD